METLQRRRARKRSDATLPSSVLTGFVFIALIGTLIYVHSIISSSHQLHPFISQTSAALLHTMQREIGVGNGTGENSWIHETLPSQLSKWNGGADIRKRQFGRHFVPCVRPTLSYLPPTKSRGYLAVLTNGGLNQMRAGVSDMVAVARIINATLVIPKLDKSSYWQDSSNFSDVFDEQHFIDSLSGDIQVVKKIPKESKANAKSVVKQFVSWSGVEYYQITISKLWNKYKIIKAVKSDARVANNNLPVDIQRLRCRAFYEALRFAPHIEALGKLLVDRMRSYGPYVALHLRYEKDMLAFSGCTHGLSSQETDELTRLRENTTHWKVKDIDPYLQRMKGRCPLTPKEIGMFISALGYPSTTPIYIAAGEIYGGDAHMADLQSLFPNMINKVKLASTEELSKFRNYASQMAALDYIVCLKSDVFIPSYSGNMARALAGHRRFLGYRKTISPDRKELVRLFDENLRSGGNNLSERILQIHKRRQGTPRKRKGPTNGTKGLERFRSEEAFYENPQPDCLCQTQS